MSKPTNYSLVATYMASLMLLGMAGLPFVLFEETQTSPQLVAGLRLTFIGVLALTVGIITSLKYPQKQKPTKDDFKVWAKFVVLAVLGVNYTLTFALFYLDDRIAMAVMFIAIGTVFIFHHPKSGSAWLAATFAIAGTMILAFYATEQVKTNFIGLIFAAIGGTAQGIMFFRKELMPKNIDPGIALGSGFLLGGFLMLTIAEIITPISLSHIDMSVVLIGTFASALMTVLAWLILVYNSNKMSGSQKVGSASFEPVGAAITQSINIGLPLVGEVVGVIFLVASAVMAVFVKKQHDKDKEKYQTR